MTQAPQGPVPYAKPKFLEVSLPWGNIFEKLLSSLYKKKSYLEVSPGSKLTFILLLQNKYI